MFLGSDFFLVATGFSVSELAAGFIVLLSDAFLSSAAFSGLTAFFGCMVFLVFFFFLRPSRCSLAISASVLSGYFLMTFLRSIPASFVEPSLSKE